MSRKYTKEDLAFIKNRSAQQKTTHERMDGKLCVVSGGTSGVGLQAVKKLAAAGADLVLVCRNTQKAQEVRSMLQEESDVKIDIVKADFEKLSEVRQAAQEIKGTYPVIDVLINSAGLHSTKRRITPDGNELVFQVNHVAPFLLTMMLLEPIKKSIQGRIIQVNSEGHRFGGLKINDLDWRRRPYIGLRAYGASKTAQIMSVRTLAEKLEGTGVTINAVHPGDVRTNIGRNNGWIYRAWLKGVVWHFLRDPQISGEAIYYLSAAPELEKTSGKYFNLTIDEKPMPHALDEEVAKQVWEKSIELAGLTL